ncbi:hypothetical protein MVES_000966 [Malassezia vespertilionis]|uniref:UBC core domain-containing protein n=1 Tax=Malassezia vespertilionis TaxID=2020962 RepID=A0A2N1JFG0_9BASI|nr:hypothetical protein MVES_000966 [Malassezia vespertilionis]
MIRISSTPNVFATAWTNSKYSVPKRRIETDVMKLIMSDYEIHLVDDNMQEFHVIFQGPSEISGSVCLDVINQTWSPMFDCINIFETFLPQLLRYPNPTDPLNGEAAAMLLRDADAYDRKVRAFVAAFATGKTAGKDATPNAEDAADNVDDDEDMSDIGSMSDIGNSVFSE